MREIRNAPEIDFVNVKGGREFCRVRLKLATPMIGGGAESGVVDSHYPIRASSVRGHLRFWWRASVGAAMHSLKEMREREGLLWGWAGESKNLHGRVGVRVEIIEKGSEMKIAEEERGQLRNYKVPAYIGGVLTQGVIQRRTPMPKVLVGSAFEVVLFDTGDANDQDKKEAIKALYYWCLYGGIGARTRRGCGSLEILNHNNSFTRENVFLGSRDGNYLKVPRLFNAVRCLSPEGKNYNASQAHQVASDIYQAFRKGKSPKEYKGLLQARGGNQGESIPIEFPHHGADSVSNWPERDSLYNLQRGNENDRVTFPRVQFGLPISFRFKRPRDDAPEFDAEILFKETERFASPLILKPFKIGNEWRAMLLILTTRGVKPDEVEVVVKYNYNRSEKKGVSDVSLKNAPDSVNPERSDSIREVVKKYAEDCGWETKILP